MQRRFVTGLALIALPLAVVLTSASAPAFAYGQAQWQVTFSSTCHSGAPCPQSAAPIGPTNGITGVWGWCDFSGSNGNSIVGTVGTEADCQFTLTFGPKSATHFSYDVTSWVIDSGSTLLSANGADPNDPSFFFTSGTMEVTGNGAFFGFPTGVPIPLNSVGCVPYTVTSAPSPLAGDPFCDSGYPTVPGHYSSHNSGENANVQVTQIP